MAQCIVIADDLTGANATGVLLKKLDLKVTTLLNSGRINFDNLSQYDVITYPTDSRGVDAEMAYNRVFNAVGLLKSPKIKLYNKRIDSTLRGNLGAEIDALLDGLGDDRIAIVVPSFPQAGRVAIGGYLLVNGVILQKTDAAKDPKNPINTSIIEKLIKAQTKYPIKSIYLDTVYEGVGALKDKIMRYAEEGSRILIIDALQIEDLDIIAEALIQSGKSFVTIDPGAFTAAVAKKTLTTPLNMGKNKILMVMGSASTLTKTQIKEVFRAYNGYKINIQVNKLIYSAAEREEEIARIVYALKKHQDQFDLFCITTNYDATDCKLDLKTISRQLSTTDEAVSLRINESLAEMSYNILKDIPGFEGVFSSGGDITVALCKRLNASGLKLSQEILPLVAYGSLDGGAFPDLKLVTKGGMVGDKDTTKICIQYLKDQL
ncbi:four-carbon acid sugar kinase family protein [Cellulosilyticum sp. I15G10I2]|uniref:four-carbon acid sugar kinase family protein n=1 Tax=Cellulosilyticum sp. I15G10I2 TaxID=1892843 RepID=UPI00085CD545|nr:four-carbon acid sugar kinase family protein [Cellulosilyticum sp. I15G10I2]